MAHLLCKLRNVTFVEIEQILKADAAQHAQEGLFLKYLWQNADDENEVLFLFFVDDLDHAKKFINKVHGEALTANPNVNLPEVVFLED